MEPRVDMFPSNSVFSTAITSGLFGISGAGLLYVLRISRIPFWVLAFRTTSWMGIVGMGYAAHEERRKRPLIRQVPDYNAKMFMREPSKVLMGDDW